MVATKTGEIIQQLKQIREEKGLSYQKIVDMVEETGGAISMSTVRRIFAEGSEDQNFRYEDSIKPLVVALLDVNRTPERGEDVSLLQHEADALRTVVSLKEQINQDLKAENERLQADYEKKIAYIKAEAEKKHEHIMALTNQSTINMQVIQSKDRIIFWLAAGLIGLLLVVCAVLVVDVLNTDIGFVRSFAGYGPFAIAGIAVALALAVIIYFAVKKALAGKKEQGHDL